MKMDSPGHVRQLTPYVTHLRLKGQWPLLGRRMHGKSWPATGGQQWPATKGQQTQRGRGGLDFTA